MQEVIDFHSTGSTAKGIKSSVFVTLSFRLPTVAEQQCIADCLTGLDAHITTASQKLDALKTHKKGLMQQLFTSFEAA
jgi:type I restriction enzyme S subunit